MRYEDFELVITSPVNLEKLVCEIYYKNEIIAEISQETENLVIEIFSSQNGEWWTFPLAHFQEALEKAKKHLLGK
ncbi:MAG: hypothetical protein H0T62_06635 [Parachlamydiaceae bacterium]|nr:hypothetical protein [Parachlamydiaceae bacterium]